MAYFVIFGNVEKTLIWGIWIILMEPSLFSRLVINDLWEGEKIGSLFIEIKTNFTYYT